MFRVSLVCVVLGVGTADAQPNASTVLANVQHVYAGADHLTAQFHQTVTAAAFGSTATSNGTLWVEKPAKFRFDYLQKTRGGTSPAKSFVFDGATLWIVDRPNLKIYKQTAKTSALPAAVSFLTNASALDSQFTVSIDSSGAHGGKNAVVLALVPKQPSAQYKQLFFVVDRSSWRVDESIVINSAGDSTDIAFTSPDTRTAAPAKTFAIDPKDWPTYQLSVVP